MQDILSMLETLRRPQLLIRAARVGQEHYDRNRHLPRILGGTVPAKPGPTLMRLIEIEGLLNEQRRQSDACYSVSRHVDVLVAMMAEAQVLRGA